MEALKIKIPIRSYTGEKWVTNPSNKMRLAIDFDSKCAYCDDHHHYAGGYKSYHVEHFAPKERFGHLRYTYDNLLYSCPYCNISKSDKWVGKDENENVVGDRGFIDPCTEDYNKHLGRDKDGTIIYKTEIGKYMYCELKLYLKRHQLIFKLEKIRQQKNKLKNKIILLEKEGKDNKVIVEAYKDLCVIFCEYYDLFFEEE